MTIKECLLLVTVLGWLGHIGLYFLLPWFEKKHQENKLFKQSLLNGVQQHSDDHIEIYRTLKSGNSDGKP